MWLCDDLEGGGKGNGGGGGGALEGVFMGYYLGRWVCEQATLVRSEK